MKVGASIYQPPDFKKILAGGVSGQPKNTLDTHQQRRFSEMPSIAEPISGLMTAACDRVKIVIQGFPGLNGIPGYASFTETTEVIFIA